MRITRRKVVGFFIISVVALVLLVTFSNIVIINSTKAAIHNQIEGFPEDYPVALLLGTSEYTIKGRTNLFFKYRIEAAAALYHNKKIKHIIVSGDNSLLEYNEPRQMFKALVKLGIPDSAITLDFAGFRTLDSVVRCKEVFGQNNFVIISQRFHVERALFIANKFNINAIAYAAQNPPEKYAFKTQLREYLAKTLAVIDVYILNTKPKFLGEKENVSF